ncbi:MAG: DUF167 domain-containing protein [Candidatus Margulisiibacteriota bacterium]
MSEILVEIKVVPGGERNELHGTRLHITSPEHDGRTNETVIDILAEHYNVKKNRIKIMKGHNSLQKTIKII